MIVWNFFKITLGYFSVSFYCLNFCSLWTIFPDLTLKEFQGFAYVLLKNLHVCILFSYQCSSPSLVSCSRQLLYVIMCYFLCQQLFSTFFNSFSLFQRRPLKLAVFQLFVVAVFSNFDNIHLTHDKSQHNFTNFFQTSILTNTHNFPFCFYALCTQPFKNTSGAVPEVSVTSICYSSIQNSTPFS